MLNIGETNPSKPVRVLIYGVEGVGKSTFGARSEAPFFITPEGGIDQIRDRHGNRLKYQRGIRTFDDVRATVKDLTNEEHQFKTLVIDSADWLEKLCHLQIIGTSGKSIITCNGGYGNGYRTSEIMHRELIDSLAFLREKKGMNVVVIAHPDVKQVKDPSLMADYDSFQIKCHDMVSSLWREWMDALLFARFRTFVKESDSNKARAISDGSRVVYTTKQPSFQAKNRYGLPPEMEFTESFWDEFIAIARPDSSQEVARILSLIKDEKTKAAAEEAVKKAKGDEYQLSKILKRLKEVASAAA